jgi:sulfatase maturation enzyme AslB (radical SAM superfamily)
MTMFLDLAITKKCNLNCMHCFLMDKGDGDMPLDMIESIVDDYMTMSHPIEGRMVLLSGGEPTCHSNIYGVLNLFHNKGWKVSIASNGYKIKELVEGGYIKSGDTVQISIDGIKEHHDIIRGDGSYRLAIEALAILKKYDIQRTIHFTLHNGGRKRTLSSKSYIDVPVATNFSQVRSVAQLAREYNCSGMCVNYFQPIVRRGLKPVTPMKFHHAQKIANEFYPQPPHCYMKGCVGGLIGLSVLPDGTYWNCSRSQRVIGHYPQKITEVLNWDMISRTEHYKPCKECMRFVKDGAMLG